MNSAQSSHPVLTGQSPFAVISGVNPKYRPEFQGGHRGFEQYLVDRGHKYEQTHGSREPTFIIHGLPRDQAMDMGRRAGQESVIYSQNGQHEHIFVNGPNAGKYHPANGHTFSHAAPTDEGAFLHVPHAGYVRFGFDTSKLLDVPKKGETMIADAAKSEVSVADFKKALAKSLQNQIDKFSKSLEEMAKTEVANSDGDPVVGELRLSKSNFTIEIPDTVCPTCFQEDGPDTCGCLSPEGLTKSAFGLTVAAAMQRVYNSYLKNVASPMFPNEPQRAHELAMQVAKDWATRTKDPQAAHRMALGHAPENYAATAHAAPHIDAPDSMGPPTEPPPTDRAQEDATAEARAIQPGQQSEDLGKDEDEHGGCPTCGEPSSIHKKYKPHCTACGTAMEEDHYDNVREDKRERDREQYAKTEGESAMCKTCKSEMCKCMNKGEKKTTAEKQAGRRALTAENFKERRKYDDAKDEQKRLEYQSKGYDATVKNMDWKTELGKSDEWMQKSSPPGFSEETMHKLKAKYGVESAEKIAWAAYKKKNHGKKVEKKEEFLSKPPVSEAQRKAMHAAASGHSTLGIPKKVGEDFSEADKGGKLPEKKAKKSEMFIDDKSAGTPPKSTDEAKHGGPRVKNVGYETDKPAEPTKEVPGKLDAGSGGEVTKGKGLKKFAGGGTAGGSGGLDAGGVIGDNTPGLTMSEMNKAKVGPPMAKPPSGGSGMSPKPPPASKPGVAKPPAGGVPKLNIKLPKAPGVKKTELDKADVVGAARIGQAAQQPIQSMTGAAPKLTPAQTGPGSSGLSLDTTPKKFGYGHTVPGMGKTPVPAAHHLKSEGELNDLKKSLGSCLLCGKAEHPGVCNAT